MFKLLQFYANFNEIQIVEKGNVQKRRNVLEMN